MQAAVPCLCSCTSSHFSAPLLVLFARDDFTRPMLQPQACLTLGFPQRSMSMSMSSQSCFSRSSYRPSPSYAAMRQLPCCMLIVCRPLHDPTLGWLLDASLGGQPIFSQPKQFSKARLLPLLFSDTSEGRGAHLVSMQCMVPKPIAAQEDICLEL